MSFQRAPGFIDRWAPKHRTCLVHIGDGDPVPGGGGPYPIPRCGEEWQALVDRIVRDRGLSHAIVVAGDGLRVAL